MQHYQYQQFKKGIWLTAIGALVLFVLNALIGKEALFLVINNDWGSAADLFFKYYTYAGDGVVWAILLLLFIKYSKENIPLLVAAFIICTLLVQVCKYVIIPDALRPISVIKPSSLLHVVAGVEPHETASFPSGHTSAAFSFFLLGTLLIRKSWIVVVGFIYALLVGVSRVYLAQHFPFDVAAGMLVGIITVLLSLQVQKAWNKRRLI